MTTLYPATYQTRHDDMASSRITEVRSTSRSSIPESRQGMAVVRRNMSFVDEDTDGYSSNVSSSQSRESTGSQYLQDVLGDVLAEALSKVARERPPDPIQYIADYLHSVKDQRSQSVDIYELNGSKKYSAASDSHLDRIQTSATPTDTTTDFVSSSTSNITTPPEDPAQPPVDQRQSRLDAHLADVANVNGLNEVVPKPRKIKKKHKPRAGTQSEPAPTNRKKDPKKDNETQTEKIGKFQNPRDDSVRRTSQSLDADTSSDGKKRPPYSKRKRSPTGRLTFSRRVPAVALTREEYRLKRGLANKLPPMSESPRSDAKLAVLEMFEETRKSSISGKQKPKQLAPLDNLDFDVDKHRKRNKKLAEQNIKGKLSVIGLEI